MQKNYYIIWIFIIILLFSSVLSLLSYLPHFSSYNRVLIPVPYDVKCSFKENNCEVGDIDLESVLLFISYFILGYAMPRYYMTVVVGSILYEIGKSYIGLNTKFIINPLIGLTAYSIGSLLHTQSFDKKYESFVTDYYRSGLGTNIERKNGYYQNMEEQRMMDKVIDLCLGDKTMPRYPDFQGTQTSLCGVNLIDDYHDPRTRHFYFSEADNLNNKRRYAYIHHYTLEEEMM